jgi:hypothetical protein
VGERNHVPPALSLLRLAWDKKFADRLVDGPRKAKLARFGEHDHRPG